MHASTQCVSDGSLFTKRINNFSLLLHAAP